MNPKIGNRVILLVCAITLAFASLFSSWGTVGLKLDKVPAKISGSISGSGGNEPFDLGRIELGQLGSVFGGLSMSFNGISGNLTAGSIKIPLWLAIAMVISGLVITIANSIHFSDFPKLIVVALLLSGIVASVWGYVAIVSNGTVGLGSVLLSVASLIGLTQQSKIPPSKLKPVQP